MKYMIQYTYNFCPLLDHLRRKTYLSLDYFYTNLTLRYKRAQYGLDDTIINLPMDFDKVQKAFPRQMDETRTLAI